MTLMRLPGERNDNRRKRRLGIQGSKAQEDKTGLKTHGSSEEACRCLGTCGQETAGRLTPNGRLCSYGHRVSRP